MNPKKDRETSLMESEVGGRNAKNLQGRKITERIKRR